MLALARRLALASAALGVLALLPAAPAAAVVVEVGGVKAGVQPHTTLLFPGFNPKLEEPFYPENPAYPELFANASGSPVLASNRTYAIYWDPTDHYHGDWQHLIDTFFHGMGAESGTLANVFAVDTQYTDRANQHANYRSTFMGAATDTEKYPTVGNCTDPNPLEVEDQITCLTDKQIRAQLETFITQHQLPKGMGTIFYLLTPPGVTVCLQESGPEEHCSDYEATKASYEQSLCSYHSDISPANPTEGNANTILYAVIPWTAGGQADGHLRANDRRSGVDCQDGGFNPSSDPPEEREKPKQKTKKQEEELAEKTPEEQQKAKEVEALEGPHTEEPNQPTNNTGPDGFYDTGLADLIINQIAIEQQNTVTDPLLNGWQDPAHNEATDECRDFFAPTIGGSVTANPNSDAGTLYNQTLDGGFYYLNDAFDLAALKLPYPGVPCLTGVSLQPQFTSPNPVNAGEIVGFDGMESNLSLNAGTAYNAKGEAQPTYATYTWNFGDGTPTVSGYAPGLPLGNPPTAFCEAPWLSPCAASTFHSYRYGGTYEVTLTVTDVGGNTAAVTEPVTVDGPPAPGGGGSGSETGSGASPGVTAPGGAGAVGVSPFELPRPVATAAAISGSLKQIAHSGLVVRYSVNEQVAGRFEVLLEAAVAHRLGIAGPLAGNLPAGSPKSLVIGRALLVTTKGGHNSVRIKFSKSIAKHLRRAHRVKLTLRLIARNASSQNPLFTTVMSTVVLHR
jgi:hypothetical protein